MRPVKLWTKDLFGVDPDASVGQKLRSAMSTVAFRADQKVRPKFKPWLRNLLLAVFGTGAISALSILIWNGPLWFDGGLIGGIADAEKKVTAVNAGRGLMLQMAIAAAAGVTVIFTARGYLLSRAGQITDRFTKAVTQLASDKQPERIGAIYALERIMRDSPKDHRAVVDVIASFVCETNPLTSSDDEEVERRQEGEGDDDSYVEHHWGKYARSSPLSLDTQAALWVLARRPRRYETPWISLGNSSLVGASFTGGWVDMLHFGGADLRGADFSGSIARNVALAKCDLRGVNFSSAEFKAAHLWESDLRGAYLRWCDFRNAGMSDSDLRDTVIVEAHFDGASMDGCDLRGVDLSSAIGLTMEQIEETLIDEETILPDYLMSSLKAARGDGS